MVPDIRIKYQGARVRLRGFGFKKIHHLRLLIEGIRSIRVRLGKAVDENDTRTKPLSKGYAIFKTRSGKGNLRNLRFTGALLEGIKPRYADDQQAIADATGSLGRIKARLYRDLLRFSPSDQAGMRKLAEDLFHDEAEQVFQALSPKARPVRKPPAVSAALDVSAAGGDGGRQFISRKKVGSYRTYDRRSAAFSRRSA